MGCDGGTIPKRDELVRTKKKKTKCAKEITNAAKWNHCHLSQEPLEKPIVADLLGFIYKKECLIEFLLDKSKYEKGPDYIKSLKDVKELDLTENPSCNETTSKIETAAAAAASITDEFSAMNKSKWICSITGLEMNGAYKFYFLFNCGCVFSERAFKTIQSSNSKCIKCEKAYKDIDLLVINPNDDDFELNKEKQKQRKDIIAKAKLEKASKSNTASASAETTTTTANDQASISNSKKRSLDSAAAIINNSKIHPAINHDSSNNNVKKVKTSSAIQEDPNTSEVYKSLFTSSSKAKNQQKAHWVTFNPQYF